MAGVTAYTAERSQQIEDGTIVDASLVANHLILTKHDGTEIDVGNVRGAQGVQGNVGPQGPTSIEVVTSATRPVGVDLFEGLAIWEEDTNKFFIWNGAIWGVPRWDGSIVAPPVWHLVGDPGEPAFQSGWGNYTLPGNWQKARFIKQLDDFVSAEGMVDGGSDANGDPIFTFPVGFRPVKTTTHIVPCSPSPPVNPGRLDVLPTGEVTIMDTDVGGGFEYISLSGIRFSIH